MAQRIHCMITFTVWAFFFFCVYIHEHLFHIVLKLKGSYVYSISFFFFFKCHCFLQTSLDDDFFFSILLLVGKKVPSALFFFLLFLFTCRVYAEFKKKNPYKRERCPSNNSSYSNSKRLFSFCNVNICKYEKNGCVYLNLVT